MPKIRTTRKTPFSTRLTCGYDQPRCETYFYSRRTPASSPAHQHAGDALPVAPHDTKVGAGVVSAVRETDGHPVERPGVRQVHFELDRVGHVPDRPVDGCPARVVQRRGVHVDAGSGNVRDQSRQRYENGGCRCCQTPQPTRRHRDGTELCVVCGSCRRCD